MSQSKTVPYPNLLEPPVYRAAYSDRTAWLMAILSKLAYVRFEDATPVDVALNAALTLITGEKDGKKQDKAKKLSASFRDDLLKDILASVANAGQRSSELEALKNQVSELQFELVKTFSVSIPFIADTQAFVVKLKAEGRAPFLALVFRGTEPRKPADLKSDLHATPTILGRLGGPGGSIFLEEGAELTTAQKLWPKVKVHSGFWEAFRHIREDIVECLELEENRKLPVYIAGHSLGGALAVVATYSLTSDRIAACYTFGSPRVGNLQFGQSIRPPVYRVVNSSDIVTRVPPGVLVDVSTILLRAVPVIPGTAKLADFLERFRGYRHYGDMRYLNSTDQGIDAESGNIVFPKLIVRANPPQMSRWYWLAKNTVATMGQAAVKDHSIDHYVNKLAYWAYVRSLPRTTDAKGNETVSD
ncbi:lipase family protein [Thalassospira tepidiphila]|uniref:lipase family protein n=1 Tax=Thalassospira tepidiphila TaxID=393657 RepID=UPI0030C6A978